NLRAARRQITVHPMLRRYQPSKKRGPSWRTNRIRAAAALEKHSLVREPVDVRSANIRVAVTAERPSALIIRQNEYNIGRPTVDVKSQPLMMISITERTPFGNCEFALGSSASSGQYFSYVLANMNLYLLPAFDPLPAIPPGNGMITPGQPRTAATPASAAASAASSVSPRNHRFPPIN